jgi:tetratricopeptide (TPR) repeat protein
MYLPLALVLTTLVAATRLVAVRAGLAAFFAAMVALGLMCHARNEDFRHDVNLWRDTVAKRPVNKRAWVFYSHALLMAGRNADSTNALLEALRHHPASPELENNVAVSLFNAGRVQDAFSHFQSALRLKPDYEEAYYNFGAVLYKMGNLAPALECFNAVIKLKPQSVEGHNYVGLCYVGLGKSDAAIPHFQRAVELDPNHAAARQNLESAKTQAARKSR